MKPDGPAVDLNGSVFLPNMGAVTPTRPLFGPTSTARIRPSCGVVNTRTGS